MAEMVQISAHFKRLGIARKPNNAMEEQRCGVFPRAGAIAQGGPIPRLLP
jgi:hypothetical protein